MGRCSWSPCQTLPSNRSLAGRAGGEGEGWSVESGADDGCTHTPRWPMVQISWSLWVKGRNEVASGTRDRWTRASLAFAETAPACLSKLLCGLSPFFRVIGYHGRRSRSRANDSGSELEL